MNSRSDDPGDGFFRVTMGNQNQTQQGFQFMGSWVPITPMKPMQGLVAGDRVMMHQEVNGGGYCNKGLVQDLNYAVQGMDHQGLSSLGGSYVQGRGYGERDGVMSRSSGVSSLPVVVRSSNGNVEPVRMAVYDHGGHQGRSSGVSSLPMVVRNNSGNVEPVRMGVYDHGGHQGVANGDRMMSSLGGAYVQGRGHGDRDGHLVRSSVASPLPPVIRNNTGNVELVAGNFSSGGSMGSGSQAGYSEFELDEFLNPGQMPCSFTSLLSGGDDLFQAPQCGTPASTRPLYNLNSPPRREAVGSVCESSLQSVLSTPSLCRTGQENGIQEKLITTPAHFVIEQRSDKSMQSIVDSSAVNSTDVAEQKDGSRQNDLGFDLNEIPQPKVSKKRKKFMPKVVVEGKPKRKPRKPATQEDVKAKESGSGKRKKAQTLKESAAKKPANVGDMSNTGPEIPLKTCKKALNFDLETTNIGLETTGDVRQGASGSEVVQNASGSSSFSETRDAAGGTSGGCLGSVTQIDQTNGLVATNQPLEASMGAKLPRVLQESHPHILAREQQPGLLSGNQQCQQPVATQNTHIPMGNRQPWLQMKNQLVGFPFGNQQPHMAMRNQQPHLVMDNQQPMYLMGTQRPALASGNQQPGSLQGNKQPIYYQTTQQTCLPAGTQQYRSPAGMQHFVVSAGGQQHGLLMKNQQPGVLLRNQQSEILMRNQQTEASMRSQPYRPLMNSQPGSSMRTQQQLPLMSQQHGSSMRSQPQLPLINQQPGSSVRSQSQLNLMNQQPGSSMRSQPRVPLMNQQHGTPKGFTHLNQIVAACMSSPGLRPPSQTPATHLHVESVSRGVIRTGGTCQRSSIPESGSLQQDIRQGNGYIPIQGRSNGESIEAGGSKRQYDRAMGQTQNHDLYPVGRWPYPQQSSQLQDARAQNSRMCGEHLDAAKKMKIQNGVQEKLRGMPPEVIEIDDDPADEVRKVKKTASINETASRGIPSVVQNSAVPQKCIVPITPAKKVRGRKKSVPPPANGSQIQIWEPTPAKTPSRGKAKEKGKQSIHDSGKSRGPSGEQLSADFMAEIISRLQNLILADRSREQDQNALVVYNSNNAVVPYETKKRKPRPKVDLDEETNRIWNLLMGKGEKEGDEDVDKKKEKWWEEERRVFRGRADSFIARMHLVQGDRRFSPWKGSVVDSVIGVFLTQNVTDHLSSSAFMSLAARFPPKPSTNREDERNVRGVVVEDPEGCILNLNDIPPCQEKVQHPSDAQVSGVDSGSKEQQRKSSNSGIERFNFLENSGQNSEEEVFSSQDSFDPAMFQSCGGVGSCSGSKSDSESPTRCETASVTRKKPDLDKPMIWQNGPTHPSSSYEQSTIQKPQVLDIEDFGMQGEGTGYSWLSPPRDDRRNNKNAPRGVVRKGGKVTGMGMSTSSSTHQGGAQHDQQSGTQQSETNKASQLRESFMDLLNSSEECLTRQSSTSTGEDVIGPLNNSTSLQNILVESNSSNKEDTVIDFKETNSTIAREMRGTLADGKKPTSQWDSLRKDVEAKKGRSQRSKDSMDSIDYEAIRRASVSEISDAIKERGMNNMLAVRIKDFLERIVKDHGAVDLEWLRDVPADKAKDYLLSIRGLGLKSVECVRLLTLHNLAFPVDTNVGRIAVRLGWVPLQPLPESLQLHLLELYPVLESIQKFLWPRLCKLDQPTLYELHYQLITFGKVFCTKSRPNCNACPMRGECRHFASAYASARLALPAPDEKRLTTATIPVPPESFPPAPIPMMELPPPLEKPLTMEALPKGGNLGMELPPPVEKPLAMEALSKGGNFGMELPFPLEKPLAMEALSKGGNCEPIIEMPSTPEQEIIELTESDIEDAYYNEDPDEIPTIELNINQFGTTLREHLERTMELQEGDMSRALVTLNPATTSIPTPKLKNISRLRTEHQVYELPDSHPLLDGMDKREPDDPSHYLLAIWTPGETANSTQPPEQKCGGQASGKMCFDETCSECNSVREANSQTVRGTILVPCRTAMQGSFPLNGTYFQVNEVFADHSSSLNPIDVPRSWIWNLPRRTVFFGTSVTSIFRGLSTEQIQYCFWKGFVCVRGFDQKTRAPRPLMARLHFTASKAKNNKAAP